MCEASMCGCYWILFRTDGYVNNRSNEAVLSAAALDAASATGRGHHSLMNSRNEAVLSGAALDAASTTGHGHHSSVNDRILNDTVLSAVPLNTASAAGHGHHSSMNNRNEAVLSVAAVNPALAAGRGHAELRPEHSRVRDGHSDRPVIEQSSVRQHYNTPAVEHRSEQSTMREHYDRLANDRAQALAEASLLQA